jgi:hypothetical protein
MASKEEKKNKGSKSPETTNASETAKKKDSVEIIPDSKSKGKKDRGSKLSASIGASWKRGKDPSTESSLSFPHRSLLSL